MEIYSKDQSRKLIGSLVEQFDRELDILKRADDTYEATIEDNYVKPLFKYLNWNIHNEGLAHGKEEFIVQYRLKRIGKKPDYLLRVPDSSSNRMKHVLFMEAKHPKYDLFSDIRWIRQCYLYANSTLCKTERPERRVPLSLLTDFEEFRLFDCRDPDPLKSDTLALFNRRAVNPFGNWCFHQYISEFDTLWDIFECSQVVKGSLDSYRVTDESLKDSRKAPDIQFLDILKSWRIDMAKDMYKNDHSLSEEVLTAASQLMVNRLVFLKMLADKELASDYLTKIIDTVGKSESADISFYDSCKNIFIDLHKSFNGSIFEERTELDSVKISNKTLGKLLTSIRPEKALYSLDAMPVRVVGTMYEEFLGEVIKKAGRGLSAEPKPEVRKAGGVYYTPEYIVDYIVDNTVGELLKTCKKPEDVKKLKFCDPACGSGSFLIVVYDRLLSWHLEYYRHEIEKLLIKNKSFKEIAVKYINEVHISVFSEKKRDYVISLTIKAKGEILKNSVFGVDIDEQAVEVTRFSLCMKTVEDYDDKDELYHEVDLFNSTILPDLSDNIKHGNSLISEDYFNQGSLSREDELSERKTIKPFEWDKQFAQIFVQGGFDAVVGNPPYFCIDDTWGKKDPKLAYLKIIYPEVYNDKTDILFYFIEKAIRITKDKTGFIVSRAFLEAYKADKLRSFIATTRDISQIIDFRNFYVFEGVGITSAILILGKKGGTEASISRLYDLAKNADLGTMKDFELFKVAQDRFGPDIWSFSTGANTAILSKIDSAGKPIDTLLVLGQGMQTGLNEAFGKRSLEEIRMWELKSGEYFMRARNSDIERYSLNKGDEYLLYIENYGDLKDLPTGVQEHLHSFEKQLKSRAAYQRGNCVWWRYTWPLHKEYYERKKILCPYMAKCNRFALDETRAFLGLTDTTVLFDNGQPESLYYILGLLNSKLLTFRFKYLAKLKSGGILEYFWNNVSKLPIKRIDFALKGEVSFHSDIEIRVKKIIELIERKRSCRTESENLAIQTMIEKADNEIDCIVYQLYGITDEEIDIIEKEVK